MFKVQKKSQKAWKFPEVLLVLIHPSWIRATGPVLGILKIQEASSVLQNFLDEIWNTFRITVQSYKFNFLDLKSSFFLPLQTVTLLLHHQLFLSFSDRPFFSPLRTLQVFLSWWKWSAMGPTVRCTRSVGLSLHSSTSQPLTNPVSVASSNTRGWKTKEKICSVGSCSQVPLPTASLLVSLAADRKREKFSVDWNILSV